MIYIGFSGHIGSGKNYIAEHIFLPRLIQILRDLNPDKTYVPYYFSFGDHLKVECLSRISYDDLSDSDGFSGFFEDKTKETRDMLQKYGTENGRNVYHQDIWVRAVDTWTKIQTERLANTGIDFCPIFVISDVRFKNEAEYIKSKDGLLVRIEAPNRSDKRINQEANNDPEIIKRIKSHASETSLDDYKFKYTISNDYDNSMSDILSQIDEIICCNLKKSNTNSISFI